MKSEKAIISAKDYGSNKNLTDELTKPIQRRIDMTNHHKPNQPKFQYDCSFCLRELPSGGHRFDGFGACPRCYRLAHLFVDALRGHRANYFSNLGVRK